METFKAWWTRDTALHSYIFCSFLIGIPFTVFNTYVVYQLQVVGYVIGTDSQGQPCTTYCIVPWGNTKLDLNSALLYLNALAFGLGGAAALLIGTYSDFWSGKHFLVTLFIVCYGALSIPVYWLQGYDVRSFESLMALYVVFNIITLVLTAALQIYIPYCMRRIPKAESVPEQSCGHHPVNSALLSRDTTTSAGRRYALDMSVFGSVAVASGGVFMLIVGITLSKTLGGTAAQSSGLLVTTIVGFITVAGSAVAMLGLPALPSKTASERTRGWTRPIIEFFTPIRELVNRRSLGALLVAYTIYVDSIFAIGSVTGQLFIAQVRPDALEYALYSLTQSILQLALPLIFLWVRPKFSIKLEAWMVAGYTLGLVTPLWGCIGLGDIDFGFKRRWEFYAQLVVTNVSGALVNSVFRVLFSEILPPGSEVQWFSMQVVLSCATIWVNYVASGPLQNATHQLRFPLVLGIFCLVCSLVIELCRVTMPFFTKDRQHWLEHDHLYQSEIVNETASDTKH